MDRARETNWKVIAAIIVVWVLVQMPFLPTAFRVDETNIVRIAERAAAEPEDPYGFFINWGGINEDAFQILANPPGVPFWLALWGEAFGWSEVVLHAAIVPFGVISLLGIAVMAREMDVSPMVATMLTIGSPAFVLASHVVMPDIAMFAAFTVAVAAALRYVRTGEQWLVPFGFLAGALAPLLKYNGALVAPLLGLIWLYGKGRRRGLFVILTGPVVGLVAWSWWSLMQYGRVHFLAMAEFQSGGATNILTALLGFFGLGVVPLVIAGARSPGLLSNTGLNVVTLVSGVLMALGARYMLSMGPIASLGYGTSAAIGYRFAVAFSILAARWTRERTLHDALLLSWVAIVVWFQFGLLFASVRYLLPILPAVIFLVLRHQLVDVGRMWVRVGMAACVVLSLAVAVGDAKTANLYRHFVRDVAAPEVAGAEGRVVFDGHWGFQYYMEEIGGEAINGIRQPRWEVGDVLIIARAPDPSYDYPTPGRQVEFDVSEYELSPGWPVRTIDCAAWANFYGPGLKGCRGAALPFGISTNASDTFAIYRAKARAQETPRE